MKVLKGSDKGKKNGNVQTNKKNFYENRRQIMLKKTKRIISSTVCMAMLASSFSACGGSSDDILFWVYGTTQEIAAYEEMTDAFNDTYGKEHGIYVKCDSKPSGSYYSLVQTNSATKSGPDVILVNEDRFKSSVSANIMSDITSELAAVTDIDLSDINTNILSRYRYDKTDNTSESDDPIYGLPIDTKPTGLYYNITLFEMAGVNCISVDEADLDAWNRNEIADNNGKRISDFEELWDSDTNTAIKEVPAKGYYRSDYPYIGYGEWDLPDEDEILVFNNRIAMNWDEVEDLARLFTPAYNSDAVNYKTEQQIKEAGDSAADKFGLRFGYFTEWWFNYAWSVGGDCLEDLTGSKDYNFSLLDPNPNFIVNEGETYTGAYTGKQYTAGETLEFLDKLEVAQGQVLVPDDEGGYTYNGQEVSTRASVLQAETAGTLTRLPSTREAFNRYLKLCLAPEKEVDGENGIYVSPDPNSVTNKGRNAYFYSGNVAMLVDYSIEMTLISEFMDHYGFKWDVAPLVVYKEYSNPNDPDDDTVKVQGKVAGMSNSIGMVVRGKSQKKDKAAAFIAWMASREGQEVRIDNGFFPNQADLVEGVTFSGISNAPKNLKVFADGLSYQSAGDWWYLPDYDWVDTWANVLNGNVRQGTMTYKAWYEEYISKTNTKLKDYKNL